MRTSKGIWIGFSVPEDRTFRILQFHNEAQRNWKPLSKTDWDRNRDAARLTRRAGGMASNFGGSKGSRCSGTALDSSMICHHQESLHCETRVSGGIR